MKKYLCVASLFLANNEIISWIALVILAVMLLVTFTLEARREAGK